MASKPIDPNDIEALRRRVAELAAAQPVQSNDRDARTGTQSIKTNGGAAVQGSVQAGGHFIGRDFIQIVTKEFHDNTEEAKLLVAT